MVVVEVEALAGAVVASGDEVVEGATVDVVDTKNMRKTRFLVSLWVNNKLIWFSLVCAHRVTRRVI